MADKLIVRDFGPIKNAELDIKKTTLLIGPQGSGKSTLAKLVAFYLDSNWRYLLTKDADFQVYYLSDYQIQSYSNKASYLQIIGKETILTYDREIFHSKINDDFAEKSEFLGEMVQLLQDKNNFSTRFGDLLQKVERPIYIPAERTMFSVITGIVFSLQANKIPIPRSLIDFGSKFESAKKDIGNFKTTLLEDVSFTIKNGQDFITNKLIKYTPVSECKWISISYSDAIGG